MRISDWSSDVCSSDLAVTTRSTRTVTVAAIATGRVVLLFLADLGEVEDLALVDPGLDADDSVGGLGLGEAVIDVGAQGMQRHAAFAIPLRTRDLGAVEAAGDVDLDAQRAQAHRVADGALHRAAEHDAALELLRDRLGDQLRVELGLADLGDVDVRRDAHQVGHFLAQLLDVLAALADHHARAGGVDRHARGLGRTLDRDAADTSRSQLLAQHLADLQVGGQVPGVFLLAGIPLGVPVLGNAQADAGRMNFMTHELVPLADDDGDVAGALEDAGAATLGARHETLQRRTFVDHDGLDLQFVDVSALVVLGVGNRRLHHLLDQVGGLLVGKLQQVDGALGGQATHLVRSEEHTSAIQSLMRLLYAVFC